MSTKLVFELDDAEMLWWKDTLKAERKEVIKKPRQYVTEYMANNSLDLQNLRENCTKEIFRIRDACWEKYIKDEVKFHQHVISKLVKERSLPREILSGVKESHSTYEVIDPADDSELNKLASIVGDYSGRIMPYLYALSLSTTNSRRSRAGQTFEEIIDVIMRAYDYPYVSQGALGSKFYSENGLGKLVDGIIPGPLEYSRNRSKCQILTMKTTLRERWQEVVEEISRTNIPHAYLLTLDSNLTESSLGTMAHHNITVVAQDDLKNSFDNLDNVISFTDLFNTEIPHTLAYWNNL